MSFAGSTTRETTKSGVGFAENGKHPVGAFAKAAVLAIERQAEARKSRPTSMADFLFQALLRREAHTLSR
jgi:hypothetical protein